MKSKWRFIFETYDFFFEKEHKYRGSIDDRRFLKENHIEEKILNFEALIKPDKKKLTNYSGDQTGILFIILPLGVKESKNVAYFLAHSIADKISLDSGRMEFPIHLVDCEQIPENDHEKELIKGQEIYCEFSITEYLGPQPFNSEVFNKGTSVEVPLSIVKQFNIAKNSTNIIEKFNGLFKIIENFSPPKSKKQYLKQTILANEQLRDMFFKIFPDSNRNKQERYESFISEIVDMRHECSHLKLYKDFGMAPTDPRVKEKIEPLANQLEILTYNMIKNVSRVMGSDPIRVLSEKTLSEFNQ